MISYLKNWIIKKEQQTPEISISTQYKMKCSEPILLRVGEFTLIKNDAIVKLIKPATNKTYE